VSRDGSYTADFADGTFTFRYGWAQHVMLQEACDAGPYEILDRLITLRCRVQDIANTIRIGLIGGGMEPVQALKKVRTYVEARPPNENLLLASNILRAGVFGAADEDEVGKKAVAENQEGETLRSPMANSDLPPSSAMGRSSAIRRKK
jgi:hypothetical protein